MNDFNSVFLTKQELKWLKKLSKSDMPLPSSPHEKGLMKYYLIDRTQYCNEDGPRADLYSSISEKGKDYLLHLHQQQSAARKDSYRFVLSTALAILALIVSLVALAIDLWQLGLL